MRTVGVEYDGHILVVGFTVKDGPAPDAIDIKIERIREYFEGDFVEIRGGNINEISKEDYERFLKSSKFHLSLIQAVADFNGQDFDPQTFRRMN